MSWQAINTRLNQRRVARSRNVVARRALRAWGAPDGDADDPEEQDPGARAVEGGSDAPEHEDAEGQDDLEPPPPDGECHPGVGVEGLDVVDAQAP